MWVDSGAASLSMVSIFFKFLTYIVFLIIIGLFIYQYLRKRNNQSLSKKIAVFGMVISTFAFLINVLMVNANFNFVQEQIEIVNNPDYLELSFIREKWIKNGYNMITWNIIEGIISGLIPFWLFIRQYKSK